MARSNGHAAAGQHAFFDGRAGGVARRREYKMQGFKCPGSAQRFLSTHAATYNTFNVQRHLTSARTHRAFRASAMNMWREAVAVV